MFFNLNSFEMILSTSSLKKVNDSILFKSLFHIILGIFLPISSNNYLFSGLLKTFEEIFL